MKQTLLAAVFAFASCTTASPPGSGAIEAPPTSRVASDDGAVRAGRGDPLTCWAAAPASGTEDMSFSDITTESGLLEPLTGMHAHAAAWGDVNGDGFIDLVVGTFANRPLARYQVRGADGPSPDTLLFGTAAGDFVPAGAFPGVLGRTSGAAIADLDGDGDGDVVLSRNMRQRERGAAPTQIYRNDGDVFTLVDLDLGRLVSGRSIGILDHDRDGLLDILLIEDRWAGARSSVLLHNEGDLRFRDVTEAAGLPSDITGLGVATSDVNGDGRTDFFVGGSNRLFVATDTGFVEGDSATFGWEVFGDEDDAAGVTIADVNRDARPDLVIGHHYNSTLSRGTEIPVRLYLNGGNDADAMPRFTDVTEAAGLIGLPTKAPHVEVVDMDNDGWPDIVTTASAQSGTRPAIFRHLGLDDGGVPRFEAPDGLGSAQYWVTGPTADIDRDGRVDILLVEWEPTLPSLMLRNESRSGNWLEVSVSIDHPVGSVVWVWESEGLDDPAALVGMREITVAQGYTAGSLPVAHFGLGELDSVDVRLVSPDGSSFAVTDVAANRHLRIPGGC